MMSGVRDQLVAAVGAGDHLSVHRLGWGDVWQDLAEVAQPKQGCTLQEFGAYARFLGDEDPAAVAAAIREVAGTWRPSPGELRGALNAMRSASARVDVGRCRDTAATPRALTAVADALRAGESGCTCNFRGNTWNIDAAGVLRCKRCNGLEWGQVYSCEDAGHIEAAA